MDTAVKTSFGAETSGLQKGAAEAGEVVKGFSAQAGETAEALVERVDHHLFGIRAMATALGTALGLHLHSISEHIAEFIVGTSKEMERTMEEVVRLGQETADIYERMYSKRRTDEQNLEELQKQQTRLLEEQVSILDKIDERKQIAKRAEQDSEVNAIAVLAYSRAANQTAEEKNRLWAISNALAKNAEQSQDLRAKIEKESLATQEETNKEVEKESAQLKKETEERARNFDIVDRINEKHRLESLPAAERLAELEEKRAGFAADMEQSERGSASWAKDATEIDRTDAEIAKTRSELAKEQAASEAQILLAKQQEVAATQAILSAERARRDFSNSGGPLGLRNLGSLSSDVLEAQADQLNRQLSSLAQHFQPSFSTPDVSGDYGYAFLSSQLSSIRHELDFRSGFSSAFQSGGRAGALDYFTSHGGDALSFDGPFSSMAAWSKGLDQQAQTLSSIHTLLKTTLGNG